MSFHAVRVDGWTQEVPAGSVCMVAGCGSAIRLGENVVVHRERNVGIFALHVDCVRAMISDIPSDESLMGRYNTIVEDKEGILEWVS